MKVLIVDDSEKWVEYHKMALYELFKEGLSITTANSAKEGVDKLILNQETPFDIILTDMQMEPDYLPLMAGEWFIKQIKEFKKYENTKIIIISAASNIRRIAEKYGVMYLPKSNCNIKGSYDFMAIKEESL